MDLLSVTSRDQIHEFNKKVKCIGNFYFLNYAYSNLVDN